MTLANDVALANLSVSSFAKNIDTGEIISRPLHAMKAKTGKACKMCGKKICSCMNMSKLQNSSALMMKKMRGKAKCMRCGKSMKNCMCGNKMSAVNPGDTDFGGPRYASKKVKAKHFSTDQRKKMAKQGTARPDGSYPINSPKDVKNAVKDALGRGHGTPADKAHIRKQAKKLGVKDPFKKKVKDEKAVGGGGGLSKGGDMKMWD